MSEFSACAACDATIRWAYTFNDRFIPLDPHPAEKGNVELLDEVCTTSKGGLHRAKVHGASPQLELAVDVPKGDRYLSHFVTCPEPERFRRRTKNVEVTR